MLTLPRFQTQGCAMAHKTRALTRSSMDPMDRQAVAVVLRGLLQAGHLSPRALTQALKHDDPHRRIGKLYCSTLSDLTRNWIDDVAQHFPPSVRRMFPDHLPFGVALLLDSEGDPYWFFELLTPYVVSLSQLGTLPAIAQRRVATVFNLTCQLAIQMGELVDHYSVNGPFNWMYQMSLDTLDVLAASGPLTVERIQSLQSEANDCYDLPSDPEVLAGLIELHEIANTRPPLRVQPLSGEPKAIVDRMARWLRHEGQEALGHSPWLHFLDRSIDLLRLARNGKLWPQIESNSDQRWMREDHCDPAFLLGVIEADSAIQYQAVDDYFEMVQQAGEIAGYELPCPDRDPLTPLEVAVRQATFTLGILQMAYQTDEQP